MGNGTNSGEVAEGEGILEILKTIPPSLRLLGYISVVALSLLGAVAKITTSGDNQRFALWCILGYAVFVSMEIFILLWLRPDVLGMGLPSGGITHQAAIRGRSTLLTSQGFWTVIIATLPSIVSAFAAHYWTTQNNSEIKTVLSQVSGHIEQPIPELAVDTKFECEGTVSGDFEGLHLWLGVEVDRGLWPKVELNPHTFVDMQDQPGKKAWGKADKVAIEQNSGDFAVLLFVATAEANQEILQWMQRGNAVNQYLATGWSVGMLQLSRVDHLRTKQ